MGGSPDGDPFVNLKVWDVVCPLVGSSPIRKPGASPNRPQEAAAWVLRDSQVAQSAAREVRLDAQDEATVPALAKCPADNRLAAWATESVHRPKYPVADIQAPQVRWRSEVLASARCHRPKCPAADKSDAPEPLEQQHQVESQSDVQDNTEVTQSDASEPLVRLLQVE